MTLTGPNSHFTVAYKISYPQVGSGTATAERTVKITEFTRSVRRWPPPSWSSQRPREMTSPRPRPGSPDWDLEIGKIRGLIKALKPSTYTDGRVELKFALLWCFRLLGLKMHDPRFSMSNGHDTCIVIPVMLIVSRQCTWSRQAIFFETVPIPHTKVQGHAKFPSWALEPEVHFFFWGNEIGKWIFGL